MGDLSKKNWRDKIEEERKLEREERDSSEMNDMFDVVKEALKVNSPISTMNSDFIMSDLNPGIIQNTVMTYVREQLSIIEIINIYLGEDYLTDFEGRIVYDESNKPINTDEDGREKINRILLNEVFSMVNLSRADKARVIEAIVAYIRGSAGQVIEQPQPKDGNFIDKLNPFKKKEGT